MKTLITSRSALLASSNFTKNWERDHNYFIPLAFTAIYGQMKNEFNRMWNDTAHYTGFKPLRPATASIVYFAERGRGERVEAADIQWKRTPWAVTLTSTWARASAT